jgi:hypothetical protein
MDRNHGLAAAGAAHQDMRTALAESNAAGSFHDPQNVPPSYPSSVLDTYADPPPCALEARIAISARARDGDFASGVVTKWSRNLAAGSMTLKARARRTTRRRGSERAHECRAPGGSSQRAHLWVWVASQPAGGMVTNGGRMRESTKDLPVAMEAPGMTVRNVIWGETAIGCLELPAGTDFTPMFKGLPDDACQCPHWGYVIKGAVHGRLDTLRGSRRTRPSWTSAPSRSSKRSPSTSRA